MLYKNNQQISRSFTIDVGVNSSRTSHMTSLMSNVNACLINKQLLNNKIIILKEHIMNS